MLLKKWNLDQCYGFCDTASIRSWEICVVGKPIGKVSNGKLRRSLKDASNAEVSILSSVLKNLILTYSYI
jgi:hypothetical protein